ncbi:MAG: hypothetical protein ABSH32_01960 [Bryobacteraceae bacterium]
MSARRAIVIAAVACVGIRAQQAPSINAGGVVNAASDAPGPVAPGSIASVYGTFPLSASFKATGVPLPTNLSGLSLQFGGATAAPLFYASDLQVNLQAPWELAGQAQTSLTATLGGQTSSAQTVALAPFAPGIFSTNAQGTGQGAILDSSNRLVDSSNPATPGSTYIQIYCTGLGPVSNQPPTGAPAPSGPLAETPTTPTVTIGNVAATVSFSGLAPGYVGLYQVNALVPAGTPAGDAPVAISIGGASSNTVTIAVGPATAPQSSVSAAGGITLNNVFVPLLYSWSTPIQVQGSGWKSGETVTTSLHGPLNWPAAPPADLPLGSLTASASGSISGSFTIPYDSGVVGPTARIPRPGTYQVSATGSVSGTVAAGATISICVATEQGSGFTINWGSARGGRLGVFPGSLTDDSPERTDPEWVTVWHGAPVSAYGTIAANGSNPDGQPALISHTDYPGTHYAHDANFYFTPDPEYQWLVGTHNYYANAPSQPGAAPDIIEIEWETLNAGNTTSYGQGDIGLPIWANPTVGDRLFVVGRWILDAGHPDTGDNTEIHPPRLIATMRQRPAAVAGSGARASQVDIYVSGHGGGANQIDPPGLTEELDQSGYGGGRIEDVLDSAQQQTYYAAGPASALLAALVSQLVQEMTGEPLTGPIETVAGPSAFPWGTAGVEDMPINDMDYDFDVPLPPPPPSATAIQMQSITHPQHSTTVNEIVTYESPVNGLPTAAHVHLPYLGADNGIYARTLQFAWNQFSSPGSHFRVQLTGIQVTDSSGPWQLWADVSGQWAYLSGLAPGLLTTQNGQTVSIPGASYDVYAQSTDTIRLLVQGYRAECIDTLFGQLFGQTAYNGGLTLITQCGYTDNTDLGGALLTLPPVQASAGTYTIAAMDNNNPPQSHFQVQVSVEYVSGP